MNYNAMTDPELIHYLDLYATDPLVRRLARMLTDSRGALIDDLVAAGMDPDTWQFEGDHEPMYPGAYIQHLRSDIDHLDSRLDATSRELDEAYEESTRLQTRTVMEFVEEVVQEKREAESRVRTARETVNEVQKENARLREQIDMWAKMNQPERKLS